MKICSVSMIKNEASIVEHFVRYNLNIFDKMIIMDNHSTDGTFEILQNLINEGLNIEVQRNDELKYFQKEKMTYLLDYAMDTYDPDIVVPLDGDEFLVSTDNLTNPRFFLEQITEGVHYIQFRTYIISELNDVFDFNNFKFCPIVGSDCWITKVILQKQSILDYKLELTPGNHDVIIRNSNTGLKKFTNSNLKMAHFPVRSMDQLKSKAAMGILALMSRGNLQPGEASHWRMVYDKIKNQPDLEFMDLINTLNYFISGIEERTFEVELNPLNTSFCRDLESRYNHKSDSFINLLNFSEEMSQEILFLTNEIELFKKNNLDK